jgi:parvulin-like peptidyl-prolyl isomerase
MPMAGVRPVDSVFGDVFFARLEALEPGAWSGPVVSGYGVHLVRVTAREPGGPPDFAAVREQVETEWRRQRAADLVEAQFARMAEAYEVERPDGGALAGMDHRLRAIP